MELENPFGCGNSPVFTYPFFGEDQLINLVIPPGTPENVLESLEIVLCIDISLSDSASASAEGAMEGCHCYLGVSDEKILKDAMLRIEDKLKEMTLNYFSITFHHSWIEYQSTIVKQQDDCVYEVISDGLVKLIEPLGFYNRIQILLPFFIEAATPIDLSDPKWSIYLSVSNDKSVINGLLTTYSYFKFPEGSRVRISQVLIFPRFQGHRLGTSLYRSVTQYLRKDGNDCVEICVEDPTDGFERLRGLVDYQEAEILGIWKIINETDIFENVKKLSNVKDLLIKSLKLNEEQAERLINLNKCLNSPLIPSNPKRFKPTSTSADDDATKLRQDVKRWLLKKYKKDLPEGKEERIGKLSELYESELIEFIEPLIDLLKK